VTIAIVVRAGRRMTATDESRGLLAGVRYVMRDSLLRPAVIAACAVNLVAQGLIVALQFLAYDSYDQNARALGTIFARFGIGALLGSILVSNIARKVDLLKLAAFAISVAPLPLFLLAVPMPWELATIVVAAFAFF